MEQGAREIIREQEEKLKRSREQRDNEKGAVKIGKKRSGRRNKEGSRENGVKCRREQEA